MSMTTKRVRLIIRKISGTKHEALHVLETLPVVTPRPCVSLTTRDLGAKNDLVRTGGALTSLEESTAAAAAPNNGAQDVPTSYCAQNWAGEAPTELPPTHTPPPDLLA